MRILFVNRMLSIERGGGETFDLEISRHLEELGCEVSYLSGLPLFSGARTPLSHSRSHTIRTPYFGWFPWDKVRAGWRLRVADFQLFQAAAVRWAARRANEFDVIQVCELPEFVHLWKQSQVRLPVVIRLTAPNFYDPHDGVRQADARIASGTSIARLSERGYADVVNVPNCVDTRAFRPHASDFRRMHGIAPDDPVILYVARFQAFKNHELLIRAFARLLRSVPAARLVLAGSGPLMAAIKSLGEAEGVGGRVLYLGEVPFEQLPGVYAGADVMAISSDYESFCFAALEAMATGLPVVTTDCGWVPRLVQHGSGGLVTPVGQPEPFADALNRLLADKAARVSMGTVNRERVLAEFQWSASARKLLAVYESLGRERTSHAAGL